MSGTILNNLNCQFICPCLAGIINIVPSPKNVTVKNMEAQMLTNKTRLVGVGVCSVLTAAAKGVTQPCKLQSSSWQAGVEANKVLNGEGLLNKNASMLCTAGGQKIICIPLSGPSIGSPSISPDIGKPQNTDSATSKPETETTDKESAELEAEEKKAEESTADESTAEPEEESISTTPDTDFAECNYKSCGRADSCEYLAASHTIERNDSLFHKNCAEKERIYNERDEQLKLDSGLDWGMQRHHLISILQVFTKTVKGEALIKLANFYGYEINNANNAIILPSNRTSGFEIKDEKRFTKAKAYEVMSITERQWHVGGHGYKISKEEFAQIQQRKKIRLRSYDEVVINELNTKLIPLYFNSRSCCRYDRADSESKAVKAERFSQAMDRISASIEAKLLAFKNPEASYPYFVSLEAMRYAYSLPRSGKTIFVFACEDGLRLVKYRYTKNKKDDNKVVLTIKGTLEYKNDAQFTDLLAFCDNTRHFFLCGADEKQMPFTASCIFHSVVCENGKIEIYHNGIKTYTAKSMAVDENGIAEAASYYIAVSMMEDDDGYYSAPQKIINERMKECGFQNGLRIGF